VQYSPNGPQIEVEDGASIPFQSIFLPYILIREKRILYNK
jgi:hypothetical protein